MSLRFYAGISRAEAGRARVAGEHQPIGYLIEKFERRICV